MASMLQRFREDDKTKCLLKNWAGFTQHNQKLLLWLFTGICNLKSSR